MTGTEYKLGFESFIAFVVSHQIRYYETLAKSILLKERFGEDSD